jgi:hypothetical protein
MTDAEKIAAFLASKGATKLPTGASNNVTSGQWYKASQGVVDLRSKLAQGPLPEPKKKASKPARKGETFFHDAYRRAN